MVTNELALPATTILVVEVGSTAHGTGIPGGEDHDETAIFVESATEVFFHPVSAAMQRTQPEGTRSGPGDTDRQLYSLRRFVRLALAGNPSILMDFWAPILQVTPIGLELRSVADRFVGRHVLPRYRGYMSQQVARLQGKKGSGGHGRRGGGRREELVVAHGYDTKFAMHAARLGYQGIELITTGRLELPIQGEPAEWLRAVRRGEVSYEDWLERVAALEARLAELESDERIGRFRTGNGSRPGPSRRTSSRGNRILRGPPPGPSRVRSPSTSCSRCLSGDRSACRGPRAARPDRPDVRSLTQAPAPPNRTADR